MRRFRVSCILPLLLVAACATPDASPPMRGASCVQLSELVAESNTVFVCNKAPTGSASQGVWDVVGGDKPITDKETPNTACPKLGALALSPSGALLVCLNLTAAAQQQDGK